MYSFKLTRGAELAEGVAIEVQLPESAARFSIGRDPSNQWAIPDRTLALSARHCEIVHTPNGPALRDASTNGTFINGAATRLSGSHLLRDGDVVAMGPYRFAVTGPKVAAAPAPVDVSLALPGSAAAGGSPPKPPPAAAWRGGDPAAMLAQGAAPTGRVGVTEILRNTPPPEDLDVEVTKIRAAPPKSGVAREGATPAAPLPPTEPMPLDLVAPPPAMRPPPPRPAATPAMSASMADDELLRHLADGLGLPAASWAGRDPAEVAQQVGALARGAVIALTRLLEQQALTRRQIGSRAPALRPVRDVNPLRVAASPEAALMALLAAGTDAQAPVQRAAVELAAHQDRLMAAFRGGVQRMGDDLAPESLDAAVGDAVGAARAAQRWDLYTGLWQGLGLEPGQPWSKGFVEAALLHLGVAYDEQGKT